jgi:hypothetical protein
MVSSIWTAGKTGITNGTAASVAGLVVLATFKVSAPGNYFVQNQSGGQLVMKMYDPDTAVVLGYYVIDSGGGAGAQGGDSNPSLGWFTGQIDVYGANGAQLMAGGR